MSAWGVSWGVSWGNGWGQTTPQPIPQPVIRAPRYYASGGGSSGGKARPLMQQPQVFRLGDSEASPMSRGVRARKWFEDPLKMKR